MWSVGSLTSERSLGSEVCRESEKSVKSLGSERSLVSDWGPWEQERSGKKIAPV